MPTAKFYNFSDFKFIGMWGGKTRAFPAKSTTYMPAFLAQHFAKHLTNRELHRQGLDNATSPKFPEQVPQFNEMFRKAYVRDRDMEAKKTDLDSMIDAVNLNRQPGSTAAPEEKETPGVIDTPAPASKELDINAPDLADPATVGPGKSAQIVNGPEDDEDEDFEGVPVTPKAN